MSAQLHFRLDVGKLESPKITPQGFIKVDGLPTRAGIFEYMMPDGSMKRELRHPQDVFSADSVATLNDLIVTNDHPPVPVDASNSKQFSVGHTCAPAEQMDNFLKSKFLITDAEAIQMVVSGMKQELSCGYFCDIDGTPGTWEGQPYDSRQLNIRYNHVAIVKEGRAGPDARIKTDSVDGGSQGYMIVDKKSCAENKNMAISSPSTEETNEQGESQMAIKIKIDSVEYELSDALAPFAKAVADKIDSLQVLTEQLKFVKAELETKQGKIDGLQTELQKKDAEVADAKKALPSEKEMVKLAKARLEVEGVAKKVLGDGFEMDSIDTIDIKKQVIEKVTGLKMDGKSCEYVEGLYSGISTSSSKASVSGVESDIVSHVKDSETKNDSTDKVKDFYLNAYKGKK